MVYYLVEHVIFDQVQTVLIGESMDKHVEKYFEAGRATKAPWSRTLRNDEFFTPMALYIQEKKMEAIAD